MKIDMNNLPKDPVLLAQMVTHLANQNDELTLKVSLLEEELTLLKRKRYSFSSPIFNTLKNKSLYFNTLPSIIFSNGTTKWKIR